MVGSRSGQWTVFHISSIYTLESYTDTACSMQHAAHTAGAVCYLTLLRGQATTGYACINGKKPEV